MHRHTPDVHILPHPGGRYSGDEGPSGCKESHQGSVPEYPGGADPVPAQYAAPLPGGEAAAQKEWDEEILHYLSYIEDDDFLGVQNYSRTRFDENGSLPAPDGAETTQMGYEFYPEAIGNVIREVAKVFHHDLIVTENGVATVDDTRRVEIIRRALAGVQACVEDGLPVKGYCYWSLMDNFEWQKATPCSSALYP